ncbi:DUF2809 domain-containing protein [Salinibacterium sp. ZJ454]|uniref:ribosomal maturation YjgA family protein n=1 Tax=Salinibacterium sp. ZJ454 TaxID=2708339 RepID=UPI00141DFF86|nr:DUF2809 domain-containing protein [Salinibacterium sp. ZJ454]
MNTSAPDVAVLRSRPRTLLAAGVLVTAAGLLVHFTLAGAAADFTADALYAVLAYLVVALLAPRMPPAAVAGIAYGLCALIELGQLTGLPAALAVLFPPARLLLGTTFAPLDLLAYAVGVAGALLAEWLLLARRAHRDAVNRPSEPTSE